MIDCISVAALQLRIGFVFYFVTLEVLGML